MTDSRVPHADGASASNADTYSSRLPDQDRATFARMTGDVDLADDIRLIRTVIASLLDNLRENYRHFGVLFGVLARAVGLQMKGHRATDDIESAILQAADDALHDLQPDADPRDGEPDGAR